MSRPWIAIVIAWLIGAALGGVALLGAVGAAGAVIRRRPGLALLGLAVAAGGVAGVGEARWRAAQPGAVSLPAEGEVIALRRRGARLRVTVALDEAPAYAVDAWLDRRPVGLAPGARVRLTGRLVELAPRANPGGHDPIADGRRRGVAWRLRGVVLLRQAAPGPRRAIEAARDGARARLAGLRHRAGAGILTGLLLGDRAAVPPEARAALERAGLGHLLAVSGLHVGGVGALLAGCIVGLARRRRWRHVEWWVLGISTPFIAGFVTLAGFPLSAARAAVMIGLYLLGRALHRPPDPLNLLGLAALWAVALRPSVALTPAFQLSFGAVAGLLLLCPRPTSRIATAGAVAAVAALVTAPLQAAWFGTFAPIAALANLALLPVALPLVSFALLALLVAPWWTAPLEHAAAAAEALADVAGGFGDLLGLWHVGTHGAWWLAVGPVALLAWRLRRPRLGLGLGLACLAIAWWARPADGTVQFVSIGQGDAVLIRTGGQALLVDTGPPEAGDRLLGVLQRAGVDRLDAVFLSHGHPDHDGGLGALVGAVAIDAVYTNGRPRAGRSWRRVVAALAARGVRVERARPGRTRRGALTIEVAHPLPDPSASENDASITLAVHGPRLGVLLTGDLEADGEAALLGAPPRFETPVVLKAPHHGSKTSSGTALLDALAPAAAVFTVGRHNRFHFPHDRVVARYRARGVPTWRTDRAGLVRVDLITGQITPLRGAPVTLGARRPSLAPRRSSHARR